MSGHSKWHSIRHQKASTDAAKGKVFTKHAKLIAIAARDGGDIELNPALRLAIENAKRENMPNMNIERAIKKGTGEDKDGVIMHEILYEGYGTDGIAILVKCLTENKNRTVASVRSIFSKNGGSLGESGTAAFLFDQKGLIIIENATEEMELDIMDFDNVEDVSLEDGVLEVVVDYKKLFEVKLALENKGFKIASAEIVMLPQNKVFLEKKEDQNKILRLLELLEDDDDVIKVYSNFDFNCIEV